MGPVNRDEDTMKIDVEFAGDGYHVVEGQEMHRYKVTLHYAGRTMQLPYFRGMGLEDTEPTAAELLYSILSDLSADGMGFDDFCADYGYDPDSRKAYATWEAVQQQCIDFMNLLDADWGELSDMLNDLDGDEVAIMIAGETR
jgi:hypothetical protein